MSNSASIAAAKKRRSQPPHPISTKINSKININNNHNDQNDKSGQNNLNNQIGQNRQRITALQLLSHHDLRILNLEKKLGDNNHIANSDLVVSDNKLSNKVENNTIEITGFHNKMNKIKPMYGTVTAIK